MKVGKSFKIWLSLKVPDPFLKHLLDRVVAWHISLLLEFVAAD